VLEQKVDHHPLGAERHRIEQVGVALAELFVDEASRLDLERIEVEARHQGGRQDGPELAGGVYRIAEGAFEQGVVRGGDHAGFIAGGDRAVTFAGHEELFAQAPSLLLARPSMMGHDARP
jgi:hypothetical protein